MKSYKILWILLIAFICIIFVNAHNIKEDYNIDELACIAASRQYDEAECIVYKKDIVEEQKKNIIDNYLPNQIGYIKIDGTNIDGAIMQYSDNDFYLNHDNYNNYYVYGSIYMDYRNTFNDKKFLIFGHNTKGNSISPLHDLEKYEKFSFYQGHPYILIELNGQKNYWQVFSILVVSNKSNKHMKLKFTGEEWNNHLEWLKSSSLYDTGVNVNSNDQIVTIQTCYYGEDETFILVSAKKEK